MNADKDYPFASTEFVEWFCKKRVLNRESLKTWLRVANKNAQPNSVIFSHQCDAWNAAVDSVTPNNFRFATSFDLAKELGATDAEAHQFETRIENLSGNAPKAII